MKKMKMELLHLNLMVERTRINERFKMNINKPKPETPEKSKEKYANVAKKKDC